MTEQATNRGFPWGQIGVYLAILFWLVALVSGTVGTYDIQPSGSAALACMALLGGAVVCGAVGVFRPGIGNRLLGLLALLLTGAPLMVILIKR